MVWTQISLTEEQMAALRELADRRGESVASIVREAVDAALAADEQSERRQRALESEGAASGPATRTSPSTTTPISPKTSSDEPLGGAGFTLMP